jgi:roadblock/LC7 domain-containing protein
MLAGIAALPGVVAVCRFRDDGSLIEAEGSLPVERIAHLARFAQWYRRVVASNVDLLSLLGGAQGWSPAQGWIMRGAALSACGIGNLLCAFESADGRLNDIMRALDEAARA